MFRRGFVLLLLTVIGLVSISLTPFVTNADDAGDANTPEYAFWGVPAFTKAPPLANVAAMGTMTSAFTTTDATDGASSQFVAEPELAQGGYLSVPAGGFLVTRLYNGRFWFMVDDPTLAGGAMADQPAPPPPAPPAPIVVAPKANQSVQQVTVQKPTINVGRSQVPTPSMNERMVDVAFNPATEPAVETVAIIRGPRLQYNSANPGLQIQLMPPDPSDSSPSAAYDAAMAVDDRFTVVQPNVGQSDVEFLSAAWVTSELRDAWTAQGCGGTCSKVILFYIDLNSYDGGEVGPAAVWEQDAPDGPLQMRYCNYKWSQ